MVTLKDSFLQHLENGKYTITLEFSDGHAEGIFKISAPMDDSNPKTGDATMLWLWILIVTVCLCGAVTATVVYRKKYAKK